MDINQVFQNGEPIAGVRFSHNQYVRVIAGSNVGHGGSLISLEGLSPAPKFLIELESGVDAYVTQDEIENAE